MSRRKWRSFIPKPRPEWAYIYDGNLLPGYDGVAIQVPTTIVSKNVSKLKVWYDGKLAHTELVDWRIQPRTYYTLRQEGVQAGTHVQIVAEDLI